VSESIQYKKAVLHYSITGTAADTILLFHGFGQSKDVFHELTEVLSKKYTVYNFDLFFHGKSRWNNGEQPLEKVFWKELMARFLNTHQLKSFGLLGFSLGSKFALATLEAFPSQTKEIILLAPDGIKTNFWYALATYPFPLRNFFKSMIMKPERFRGIVSLCQWLGLVDKGIIRFAASQMNTEEKRNQVYHSWVVFRHLQFNLSKIAAHINATDIQTTVVIGKFDKIITTVTVKKFVAKLKSHQFELLETSHNGLIATWAERQKVLIK
jgi:pimeloyl-ACP methyl ester carboxylesterase